MDFRRGRGLLHGESAVRSGAGFLVLWLVRGSAAHFRGACSWGCGVLFRGHAVRSGAGFLVVWVVRGEMLPILGLIFPRAWVVAQGRGCLFGSGFPGAAVGEGGNAAHVGMDFREGVSCCSGERLSVGVRVSCCCGW